jgi:hypothetical protein
VQFFGIRYKSAVDALSQGGAGVPELVRYVCVTRSALERRNREAMPVVVQSRILQTDGRCRSVQSVERTIVIEVGEHERIRKLTANVLREDRQGPRPRFVDDDYLIAPGVLAATRPKFPRSENQVAPL